MSVSLRYEHFIEEKVQTKTKLQNLKLQVQYNTYIQSWVLLRSFEARVSLKNLNWILACWLDGQRRPGFYLCTHLCFFNMLYLLLCSQEYFLAKLIMIFLASVAWLVSTPILQYWCFFKVPQESWIATNTEARIIIVKVICDSLIQGSLILESHIFGNLFTECKSKDINLTTGPQHLLGWHIILYGVTRFWGLWLEAAVWFSYGVNPATSWPQLLWQRRPSEWKMVAETTFVNQMCFISSRPISLMLKETWPSEWRRARQRKLVKRSPSLYALCRDLISFRSVRRLTNWAQWDKL